MSEPFVGQITMFAGNFAPRGWAFCDGQLMAVSQNDALFSLIGTIYGGDGRTTFALPDMRGRLPVHQGAGPGLSDQRIGAKGGQESDTLTIPEMAAHSHSFHANTAPATGPNPQGNLLAQGVGANFFNTATPDQMMNAAAIASAGGSQPHTNLMPSLCVNFIIALFGIYPSRH